MLLRDLASAASLLQKPIQSDLLFLLTTTAIIVNRIIPAILLNSFYIFFIATGYFAENLCQQNKSSALLKELQLSASQNFHKLSSLDFQFHGF
ncbi:MAG: hypothetical protein ACEY3J_01180 [Arsenophonus sp.]